MRIPRKAQYVVGAVVLVVLAIAALPLLVDVNSFLPEIDSQLTAATGRPVTLGHISLNLFTGGLVAKDLSVADDPAFSNQPFLQAKSLHIEVELLPLLLHQQLQVREFKAVDPAIQLIQNAAGKWNFSTLGTSAASQAKQKPESPSLSVGSLAISNARLSMQTLPSSAMHVYDKVNIKVKNFSFTSQFSFTLTAQLPAGGDVKLDGTAGPIDPVDNTQTPLTADLTITHMDPVAAGFLSSAGGVNGVLDVTAHLSSDGKTAQLNGKVTGNKMRFAPKASPAPQAVTVDFMTSYTLAAMQGVLSKGAIGAGTIHADVTGTYLLKPAGAEIHMNLSAPGMSVDGLQDLLPAFGVVLPSGSKLKGGTLGAALKIDGPMDKLVIAGPVDLNNSQLQGFSLASKLHSLPVLDTLGGEQGVTTIQRMHTDLRMTPQQIETSNISAVVPSLGQATGSGVILPDGGLNYRMQVRLSALNGLGNLAGGLGALLGGGGKSNSGSIPLLIRGTTSNPSFSLDAGELGKPMGAAAAPVSGSAKQVGSRLKGLFGR